MRGSHFSGLTLVMFLCWPVFSGEGSNLGVQATQYEPPTMSGVVTTDAGPAANAVLTTLSGFATVCDAGGNYQITFDAPGIYTVIVRKGLNILRVDVVELTIGQNLDRDFDLGQFCDMEAWIESQTINDLLACMIANQTPDQKRSAP